MKILITCLLLFSIQIFSQNFLNIRYSNGVEKYTALNALQKITISSSGDQISFHLTDGTTVTENVANLLKMTLGDAGTGDPLPVELTSFSASVNGASVFLSWITETEVNNYGFEIERASSLTSPTNRWQKIGFVQGHGNSNSPKEYSFTDIPQGGTKFQYRLKQIDTDGKFNYSTAIVVDIETPNKFELKQNTPNPFNPTTRISYSLQTDGLVMLDVYDIIGREVASLEKGYKEAGSYSVTFDGSKFSSGVYLCKLTYGLYTASIKMILMK
jgi:hypothetical protein